jgi:hypothetical protein
MHDWQAIWLIPATMGAVLVIVFALLFKDNTAKEPATT